MVYNSFHIYIYICNDIDRLCANFWWGSVGDKSKMHWMGQEKVCSSKDRGDMGFRELQAFDQAMLVKQSRRLARNPKSLLYKTLRGRYFKDENFLKASIGSNPSMTWRSICWGRQLFLKGYMWKIGNGSYSEIEKDPWICRPGNKKPIFIKEELEGQRVKCLLDKNNNWARRVYPAKLFSPGCRRYSQHSHQG